ncbi:hypothetical protein FB470_000590 [Amycolatopsis thermophila]|uniref:HNH endonuclease n=1 Tax=Amycolatopsis thermophila TaxID=206084 RepID=A0ABU0ENL7_9PSEU|nr:hypothetical protein [Amycolatopsis thermophila]
MFKRKKPTPPPPGQFVAKYDGECAACGAGIKAGDQVGRVFMARRRIGGGIADDPRNRVCCARCHADAAVKGDPSLRW